MTPSLLQRAAAQIGAGPVLDRLGIEPLHWSEGQLQQGEVVARGPQLGAMFMPEQSPLEPPGEIRGHTAYSIDLGPGFPEIPTWPDETWLLKSFQVELSGTLLTEDEIEFAHGENLDVVLALRQGGLRVWSQSLSLPLLVVPGTENREFAFTASVFVDLQNGLSYSAASGLAFVVSGIAPSFVAPPTPPPMDAFETQSLEIAQDSRALLETIATELEPEPAPTE